MDHGESYFVGTHQHRFGLIAPVLQWDEVEPIDAPAVVPRVSVG
jgi:hypothetical protein